jgi:hypothetical protein
MNFYETQLKRFRSGELKAKDFAFNDKSSNEQAAWATVARVLLNLDEAITKE